MNDVQTLEIPLVGPDGYDPLWDDINSIKYYDRRGNVLTFREWVSLMEHNESKYKIVQQEEVGSYWVSTVWLGIDHGFGVVHGAPLIFETMVFNHSYPEPAPFGEEQPEQTSADDLDMRRYSTEAQALAGHNEMVAKVRLFVAIEEGEQRDDTKGVRTDAGLSD